MIWRFMDFAKYVDLLDSRALFFARSDRLGDPFEGAYPKSTIEKRQAELAAAGFDGDALDKRLMRLASEGRDFRQYVALTCWHMNTYESAAMWSLYARDHLGIAIQSSRDRLSSATMGSEPGVWTVPVAYIDFGKDDPPVPTRWAPFRYKRHSFAHEQELRAMVFCDSPLEDGIRIPVEVDVLIDEVYVSPTAPNWFKSLVQRVGNKYGLSKTVRQSSISSESPQYM